MTATLEPKEQEIADLIRQLQAMPDAAAKLGDVAASIKYLSKVSVEDLDAIEPDEPEPETKGKKPLVPTVPCDRAAVEEVLKYKKDAADNLTMYKTKAAALKARAEPLRVIEARKAGEHIQSICLDGLLRYTSQNKFRALPVGAFDEVSKVFGPHFGDYIHIETSYEVDVPKRNALIADPEVVAAFTLLRKRGLLPQTRTGKPTEMLFNAMTFNPDVRAKALALGIVPQSLLALPKAVSK